MEYTTSDALSDAQLASDNLHDSTSVWSNGIDHMDIMKASLRSKLSGYVHHVRYLDAVESILNCEVDKVNRWAQLNGSSDLRDSTPAVGELPLETMLLQGDDVDVGVGVGTGDTGFPQTVNLSRLLEEPVQSRLGGVRSASEGVTAKQLKKDVERDTIVANGVKVVGANVGVDGLLGQLERDVDALLAECRLPVASAELRRFLLTEGLKLVTRSNSGVVAFQLLQALSSDAETVLLPVSEKQYPLRVDCRVGGFEALGPRWGLVVQVETAYLFRIIFTPPLTLPRAPSSDPASTTSPATPSTGSTYPDSTESAGETENTPPEETGDVAAPNINPAPIARHVLLTYSAAVCVEVDAHQKLLDLEPVPQGATAGSGDRSKSMYQNIHFCDECVKMECIEY